MRKLVVAIFGLLFTVALMADVVELRDGHPDEYVVKKGDTLWDISNTFLNDPWLWPEIWHVNPQIENPHLIYPGDLLKLIYLDGKDGRRMPHVTVARRGMASKTVTLSPKVKSTPLDKAIPSIPLDVIGPFLSRSRILNSKEIDQAPYVIAGGQRHLIVGAGDLVYARGNFDVNEKLYGFYRPGKPYIDPVTEEVLGYSAKDIATGKLLIEQNSVARVNLNSSNEEVRAGDRLLPMMTRRVNAVFYPSAPVNDIKKGYILSVENGVSQVGPMSVVVISKGEREGLEAGNILSIYRKGEVVRDQVTNELVELPSERAGLMMVFRTFDKASYAVILSADEPLSVGDEVRNP